MELHAPGAVAEPERLRAQLVARELDGAGGEVVRVVVPLERVEARRQPAEEGIVVGLGGVLQGERAGVRQRAEDWMVVGCGGAPDGNPADLRLAGGTDVRARGLREQLRAEADAEQR